MASAPPVQVTFHAEKQRFVGPIFGSRVWWRRGVVCRLPTRPPDVRTAPMYRIFTTARVPLKRVCCVLLSTTQPPPTEQTGEST